MQHLIRTADLRPEGVRHVLGLAADLRRDPRLGAGDLAGRKVVFHQSRPATRVRRTFSAAAERLGAELLAAAAGDGQHGRHGDDRGGRADRMPAGDDVAAVVVAHGDHDGIRRLADGAVHPVVNARSDRHHPCQGLADLLTLHDAFGCRGTWRVAHVGEADATATSLLEAGALAGLDLVVATPEGCGPPPETIEAVRRIGRRTGARLRLTHDPVAAVVGADAVHAGPWFRLGLDDEARAQRRSALRPCGAVADLVELAAPHAVLLQAAPVHPDDELPPGRARRVRSLAREQAVNLTAVAAAVLLALHRGDLPTDVPIAPEVAHRDLVTARVALP